MPRPTRELQREYQRNWCAHRRKAWFEGKTCHGCGSAGPLEMHHLDPDEKVTHAIWSWTESRRDAELAKCIPLCVDCHKEVTNRQKRVAALKRNPHGTQNRYCLGCRCEPCKVAHRDYNAAHPAKKDASRIEREALPTTERSRNEQL